MLWGAALGMGGFLASGSGGWGAGLEALLSVGGALTALPLIGFAYAVRRIPLTVVGLLQYIAPTLQFLVGVLVFHEAYDRTRAIGFGLIWVALAIYSTDGSLRLRVKPAIVAGP